MAVVAIDSYANTAGPGLENAVDAGRPRQQVGAPAEPTNSRFGQSVSSQEGEERLAVDKKPLPPLESAAVEHVKKGEDSWCIVEYAENAHFFGIFDGHGGGQLARALAKKMPRRLKKAKTKEQIIDAYYEIDEELGPEFATEGSTAACAKVERIDNTKAIVTLSWVGDSRAVAIDMASKKLIWQSSIHHMTNEFELERLRLQWELRSKGWHHNQEKSMDQLDTTLDNSSSGRPKKTEGESKRNVYRTSSEPTRNSLDDFDTCHEIGHFASVRNIREEYRELLSRSFRYEQILAESDEKHGVPLVRCQSFVGRRTNAEGRPVGPTVLKTLWKRKDGLGDPVCGASTCVSRSLGDYDSSRCLIPHPDISIDELSVEIDKTATSLPIIKSNEHNHDTYLSQQRDAIWRRYVLASDGLWDVVNSQQVAKLVANEPTPQLAADALLAYARRRYLKMLDKTKPSGTDPFKDDTTVIVFDVSLGDISHFARPLHHSYSTSALRRSPSSKKRLPFMC
mmetsp:Transcript_3357/g.4679  ORF Transcript_3357/g.4679 Transcript_3357/m.4679 type:complete len:509 (+) Transcript_3357:15-1541(+)